MRHGALIATLAAALATQATRAHAQQGVWIVGRDTTERPLPFAPLVKGIELSPAQVDSMKAIWKRFEPMQQQIAREGGGPDIQASRTFALSKQRRAAARAQLTSAQQVIFDKNAEEADRQNAAILKALKEKEDKATQQ